ncbi:MAG: hypothetical protein FWD69_03470 [Polyangiaceae bacterium]|nr:hypothetical protein [Polyangiaceae bacterium]
MARGDRIAAIALGKKGAATAAAILSMVGSLSAALSAHFGGRSADAFLLAGAGLPMIVGAAWVCASSDPKRIYQRISILQISVGIAFGIYAVARIATT